MPFPPPPTTYSCPKCGWKKTVAPKSDALLPGDFYNACPSCGNTDLECKMASGIRASLDRLRSIMNR